MSTILQRCTLGIVRDEVSFSDDSDLIFDGVLQKTCHVKLTGFQRRVTVELGVIKTHICDTTMRQHHLISILRWRKNYPIYQLLFFCRIFWGNWSIWKINVRWLYKFQIVYQQITIINWWLKCFSFQDSCSSSTWSMWIIPSTSGYMYMTQFWWFTVKVYQLIAFMWNL